jgi:xanthine dehydrogenase small subunit
VGTKIMCAEGDCGACTVLVAEPIEQGRPRFLPIDSCIRFLFQVDGCHVVTVDGLAQDGDLAPVQRAMIDCHGSQCGFCTPGFVMALAGGCHAQAAGEAVDWRKELAGDLCRCTGYVSIVEAAERAGREADWLATRFADESWMREGVRLRRESLDVRGDLDGVAMRATCPATLAEALAARGEPAVRAVAGATDLGVLWNKGTLRPRHWLDLSRVAALRTIEVVEAPGGATLVAGPLATWTDMLRVCAERCDPAVAVLESFGGPQIRHVGTLGGNIVNGSPIADSLPLLFAMEATLDLASAAGTRAVPIPAFFKGYKQLDLAADELLVRVRMPLPEADDILRLVKVSRRRDLDISTFTSAILVRRAGDRIARARVAYGGVGPNVVRMRGTEAALVGPSFTEATFRRAGDVAAGEIRPLTDVHGSAGPARRSGGQALHARGMEPEARRGHDLWRHRDPALRGVSRAPVAGGGVRRRPRGTGGGPLPAAPRVPGGVHRLPGRVAGPAARRTAAGDGAARRAPGLRVETAAGRPHRVHDDGPRDRPADPRGDLPLGARAGLGGRDRQPGQAGGAPPRTRGGGHSGGDARAAAMPHRPPRGEQPAWRDRRERGGGDPPDPRRDEARRRRSRMIRTRSRGSVCAGVA